MAVDDLLRERLKSSSTTLSPTARRVGQFIDQNRVFVLASSAADVAHSLGTSDATVIRSIQALGFEGLADLRQTLVASLQDAATPADIMLRTMAEVGTSAETAVASVIDTHLEGIRALASRTAQQRIVAAIRVLHPVQRILIFGIGPSTGIADYMRRILQRNGRIALSIGSTGNELADQLIGLRDGDGLLVMAYGRMYPELEVVFEEAASLGLPLVLLTDKLDRTIAQRATVVVPAKRGREERVALHAATLVVLEAIALGLAASNRADSIRSLQRLNLLRKRLSASRADL